MNPPRNDAAKNLRVTVVRRQLANPIAQGPFRMLRWNVTPQNCILTFSGVVFSPLDPNAADIRIKDIAHALAFQCRFGGHAHRFYSVAEHSVHVSHIVSQHDALWGLLHDASEAYLSDVPRPLKALPEFDQYRRAERRLQAPIVSRFELGTDQPASGSAADDLMLLVEYRDLMKLPPCGDPFLVDPPAVVTLSVSRPWSPKDAERRFLRRFSELSCGK